MDRNISNPGPGIFSRDCYNTDPAQHHLVRLGPNKGKFGSVGLCTTYLMLYTLPRTNRKNQHLIEVDVCYLDIFSLLNHFS